MENLPRKNDLETFQEGSAHPYGIFDTTNRQWDKQEAVQRTCGGKKHNEWKNKNKESKVSKNKTTKNNQAKQHETQTKQNTTVNI